VSVPWRVTDACIACVKARKELLDAGNKYAYNIIRIVHMQKETVDGWKD